MQDANDFWGEPIHSYTRAQAIEDGFLVDVTDHARGHYGMRLSVAITRTVWESLVAWTAADSKRQTYQDQSGRLHDVLWMARGCFLGSIRKAGGDKLPSPGSVYRFKVLAIPHGGRKTRPRLHDLHLGWTTTDDGQPALTIMLPGEA